MTRFDPEKLKAARGDRSLEELAKSIDVSRQTISRWEKGEGEPNASELAAIAQFTGKPLKFFYEAA